MGTDDFGQIGPRGVLRWRPSRTSFACLLGVKKWSAVTRRGGKQVRTNIGDFPGISLADARKRAEHILSLKTQAAIEGTIPSADDIFPSLQTLCEDYVAQMKAKGQASYDAYHRALIRSDHSFCNYMARAIKRPPRAVDAKQEHAVDWLSENAGSFAPLTGLPSRRLRVGHQGKSRLYDFVEPQELRRDRQSGGRHAHWAESDAEAARPD